MTPGTRLREIIPDKSVHVVRDALVATTGFHVPPLHRPGALRQAAMTGLLVGVPLTLAAYMLLAFWPSVPTGVFMIACSSLLVAAFLCFRFGNDVVCELTLGALAEQTSALNLARLWGEGAERRNLWSAYVALLRIAAVDRPDDFPITRETRFFP